MTEVALAADVTGLATAVAALHDGFEGPSTVDIHMDVRAKGCALLQGLWQWGDVSRGTRRVCVGEQDMSSVWVRSEWGGI
jgi:hypothetical protein